MMVMYFFCQCKHEQTECLETLPGPYYLEDEHVYNLFVCMRIQANERKSNENQVERFIDMKEISISSLLALMMFLMMRDWICMLVGHNVSLIVE